MTAALAAQISKNVMRSMRQSKLRLEDLLESLMYCRVQADSALTYDRIEAVLIEAQLRYKRLTGRYYQQKGENYGNENLEYRQGTAVRIRHVRD